ncbi:MAG: hypothetical protein INR71_15030 [Terriglobus roseus]|nr:hypothetical protein [Terriglobus roseus]
MTDVKKPLRKIICKDLSQKKFEVEVYEGDKVRSSLWSSLDRLNGPATGF